MRQSRPTKLITLHDVKVVRASAAAVLLSHHDWPEDVWMPLSQIREPDDPDEMVGQTIDVVVPEWLAKEKGVEA